MHYYKFNIGDWHLHTSHLTLVEEAVYFRLVNHYYNTEKPFIKSETQTLIRRLRLGNESVTVEIILSEFFVLNGESYVHTRCEKEIKSFKKKAKVNKANGSKGGRPRIDKGLEDNPEETQTVTTTNPNVTLNTNHKPLTTNQEPLISNMVANAPVDSWVIAFEFFWNTYDKKEGRHKCELKFKKLTIADRNALFHALPLYIQSTPDKQYRKNPLTWLNGKHWNDEITTPVNPSPESSTGWSEGMWDKNFLES